MMIRTAFAAAIASMTLIAAPAIAQDQPGDRVNQLIVYGEDECPVSTEEIITVCARKEEAERFRIPEALRVPDLGDTKTQAWAARAQSFEYVGKSGTESCSPNGAGGFTGCTQSLIAQAYAERGIDPSVQFGQLIQAEREKRLAKIDAEAEAVEARIREREEELAARKAEETTAGALVDGDGYTPKAGKDDIGTGRPVKEPKNQN